MLNPTASNPSQTPEDREARIQALLAQLRPNADQVLRQMAEHLVDLPQDKAFGQIEYDLRDLAHDLAASSHQAGRRCWKTRPPWRGRRPTPSDAGRCGRSPRRAGRPPPRWPPSP